MWKLAPFVACLIVAASPARAAPPMPATSTDPARCEWQWKSGGGLGLWTETCRFDTGLWEPRYEADLPGFVLTVDGEALGTVVQVFAKPADAPIEAILPALRAGGHIPDDDDCFFEAMEGPAAAQPRTFYEIRPRGARLAAFRATPADEVPEPPCGEYGWSTHGTAYFMVEDATPDRVVYINTGQDGTMIDPDTIVFE